MSTQELREKLIEKIKEEQDTDCLEMAFSILDKTPNDTFFELNSAQMQAIAEADGQFEKGEYLTQEESKTAFEKWKVRQ